MRLLVDQDVYTLTIDWLRREGHDLVTAQELGMQRAPDDELLQQAKSMDRRFLTRDKGFGTLVFLQKRLSAGVILLRISPATIEEVHRELRRLLQERDEEELRSLFCVVESRRYRIRHLS